MENNIDFKDTPEMREKNKRLHEKAMRIRGRFINTMTFLDRKISKILADYFCSNCEDKRNIFLNKIVGAEFFTLTKKINILKHILKSDYPDYYKKNKECFNFSKEVVDFRNTLAHSILEISSETLEKQEVRFIGIDSITIVDELIFNDRELQARALFSRIEEMERLLPFKERETEILVNG